jgi:hypothetical protein
MLNAERQITEEGVFIRFGELMVHRLLLSSRPFITSVLRGLGVGLISNLLSQGKIPGCFGQILSGVCHYHTTRQVSVRRMPTAPAIPVVTQLPNDCRFGLSTKAINS